MSTWELTNSGQLVYDDDVKHINVKQIERVKPYKTLLGITIILSLLTAFSLFVAVKNAYTSSQSLPACDDITQRAGQSDYTCEIYLQSNQLSAYQKAQ